MITEDVMPWQAEFINERKARYLGLMAGRRAGKTHAISRRLVSDALARAGHRAYYLTPDGALCHEVFREIAYSPACERRIRRIEMQPIRQVYWRNGSRTMFRMFDRPDKSLGFGFDFVCFDEIQKLNNCRGRDSFLRVIRPLVMDRGGTLCVAGQWRGRGCWWWKWFEENKDNPAYRLWSIPTWDGYQFREGRDKHPEIEDARRVMPRVLFDQEIACIPTSAENAAFAIDDIDACRGGTSRDRGEPGHQYAIGADLGRTRDPSAWVVVDCGTKEVVYAKVRPIGERHETGAVELAKLSRLFGGASVVLDATGGATGGHAAPDAHVQFYRRAVSNSRWMVLTTSSKAALIQELGLAVEQHVIKIPHDAHRLLDEMANYEYHYNGYTYRYQGPEGHDDDLVIALALAWRLAAKGMAAFSERAVAAALTG